MEKAFYLPFGFRPAPRSCVNTREKEGGRGERWIRQKGEREGRREGGRGIDTKKGEGEEKKGGREIDRKREKEKRREGGREV